MASFTAFLEVSGQRYPLLSYDLTIHQQTDSLGRPASPTLGGQIDCTLSAPGADQPFLVQWMFSPTMQQDGKIVLLQESPKATLKTINFFNAYCTGLQTQFAPGATGGGSLQLSLRISPQRVAVGAIVHDNNWPLESHGAGETFAQQAVSSPKSNGQAKQPEAEPSALMEGLHGVLDVVGMIPVIGEVADAANAAIYLGEGRYGEAALSAASMIPLAGNVVGAAKIGRRALKLADKLSGVTALASKAAKRADKALEAVKGPLKKLRKTCGDPVDVASGEVLAEATDFSLPGPIPLTWERTWFSSSTYQGILGHGWSHCYDWAIIAIADDGTVGIRDGEGRLVAFEAPQPGGKGIQSERLALFLDGNGSYRVWHMDELRWYLFGAAAASQTHKQPLQRIEDPNGFSITFTYRDDTHLSAITDSAGRVLPVETNEAGRITAIYSPQAAGTDSFALVRYVYDDWGSLVTVIDAEENPMHYRYQNHQLIQRTARMGANWYFEYESDQIGARCVHTWGDGGLLEYTLHYDSPSQTTVLDSYQQPTVYTHQDGLVTRQVDALGGEQLWTYSETNQLLAYRDALGNGTRYNYDEWGNRLSIANPDGTTTPYGYDERNLLISSLDPRGGKWVWSYDERGNLLERVNPLYLVVRYAYDERYRLSSIISKDSPPTHLRYDEQHNVAHLIILGRGDANEQIWSRTYDGLGRVRTVTQPNGSVQQRSYDRLGQLTLLIEADETTYQIRYDSNGNVVEIQQGDQLARLTYTALGKVALRYQAGQTTEFTYDLQGRLIGIINEAGQQYQFGLNAMGLLVEETGFDGLLRRYERNQVGQVVQLVRPAGRQTKYGYDAMGRMTKVTYGDGTFELYDYDEAGDLIKATNETTTVRLERNLIGQVVRETQGQHEVEHTYDQFGQRLSLTSSLGASVTFERNEAGLINRMQAGLWAAQFTHDSFGSETERYLNESVRIASLPDQTGRTLTQQITVGDYQRKRSYTWDTAGTLNQIADSYSGGVQFAHDAFGGLRSATYTDGTTDLRATDSVGNVFEDDTLADRQYGPAGELVQKGTTVYSYDEEGNLLTKQEADGTSWWYTWNQGGQLTDITRPDGGIVKFAYDAHGRRVSKQFDGVTTYWVWNDNVILHEWTEGEETAVDASSLTTWLFEDDSFAPVAKLNAQGNYSLITNQLGTPLSMFDEAGAEQWAATLDMYGRVKQLTGKATDCPFRFPGQYEDTETGLYYNRFRYYSPQEGQYISQDPIRFAGGLRYYAYVKDSTRYADIVGWIDIWYRALSPNDMTSIGKGGGIVPKNPTANNTPLDHVLNGSTPGYGDQYTSLTKDKKFAERWARRSGMDVAEIDLDKVPGNKYDLSTGAGRSTHLGDVSKAAPDSPLHSANKMAKNASELLVEGKIPQEALVGIHTPCP